MSEGTGRRLAQRMGRLVRKEVSSILRDRRTIFTLVLMPLLLYPLLSIAFRQFLLAHALEVRQEPDYRIGFRSEEEAALFIIQVQEGERLLARRYGRDRSDKDGRDRAGWEKLSWKPFTLDDLDDAVRAGNVDLGVRVPAAVLPQRTPPPHLCDLLYLEDSVRSREIKDYVEGCLAAANNTLAAALLERVRRFAVILDPRPSPLDPHEHKEQLPLPVLVPLILILMTITGAVYPAIDLTAGERERGTLEILVAAPIPRLGLLFAKYLSVVTVAVLTAVVNLVAMTGTLVLSGLGPLIFGNAGLSALAVVQVFLLLLLFAAFFSAVLLAVTSFARSFKEAQAYLIPLMLVSMTPGMLSLLPGLHLEGPMVVVPLLNIVLLARDLFAGQATPMVAALVVLTTLIYAAAAIGLAARIFGAEAVLYNEQAAWSDLFRRPSSPRPAPTLASALLCLALMFPASFVLTSLLAQAGNLTAAAKLGWRLLGYVLLFACFPLVSAWLRRVRPLTGFRLGGPGAAAWVAAVLFGLCLWPFADVVQGALRSLGVGTVNAHLLDQVESQFKEWRNHLHVAAVVLGYAVAPAVLEELFFRGYLFSALRSAGTPRTAIVGSALFFGVFHLIGQVVSVEAGVVSTLLGLLLGWLSWRTGTIVPGMILHALHNSCLVLLAYYKPVLIEEGWFDPKQPRVPVAVLLAAGAGCLLALAWLALIYRGRGGQTPAPALAPTDGER